MRKYGKGELGRQLEESLCEAVKNQKDFTNFAGQVEFLLTMSSSETSDREFLLFLINGIKNYNHNL